MPVQPPNFCYFINPYRICVRKFVNQDTQLTAIFPDLETRLKQAGAAMLAAESHGLLCARFCVEDEPDFSEWVGRVMDDAAENEAGQAQCLQALRQVYGITQDLFEQALESMDLLIPPDHSPLSGRSRALAEWCDGFIGGLGLAGMPKESVDGENSEILQDLVEITRLEDEVEDNEQNEQAYMEVIEYVRVAVKTLGISLRGRSDNETLH